MCEELKIQVMHTLCNKIIFSLNLLLQNNTYLLINAVSFKVVSLELHSASPVILPPFKAFHEVHCLNLGKCVSEFCLNLFLPWFLLLT